MNGQPPNAIVQKKVVTITQMQRKTSCGPGGVRPAPSVCSTS
jgi:hypothetical protein